MVNILLDYFQENFGSYVLSISLVDGEEICFGDLLYDYSLCFDGGKYILLIYSVELDHPIVRDDKYTSLAALSLVCMSEALVRYCL